MRLIEPERASTHSRSLRQLPYGNSLVQLASDGVCGA